MFKHVQLTKLYIENFQAIEDYQEIDISPVTILVGPNSAGKSAILDFLEGIADLVADSENRSFDYKKNLRFDSEQSTMGIQCIFDPTLLKDSYISDIGIPVLELFFQKEVSDGYEEYINVAKEKYYIDLIFKLKRTNSKHNTGVPYFDSINLSINKKPVLSLKNESFQININNYPFFLKEDQEKYSKKYPKGVWKYSGPEVDLGIYRFIKYAKKGEFFDLFFSIGKSITSLFKLNDINQVVASRKIPSQDELVFIGYEYEGGRPDDSKFKKIPYDIYERLMSSLQWSKREKGNFDKNLLQYYELALSLASKKYFNASTKWLSSQPRFHCPTCNIDEYTISAQGRVDQEDGEYSKDIREDENCKIQYCPLCGDMLIDDGKLTYDGSSLNLYGLDDTEQEIINRVNDYLLNEFMADKSYQIDGDVDFVVGDSNLYHSETSDAKVCFPIIQLYLKDANDNKLNFDDIGSGMAYCLPVLIASCQTDSIQFIQQPELHIHPSLQSRFAKIFVNNLNDHHDKRHRWSNKPNLQYMIETHSEHLILSFLKIIRDKYNQQIDGHFSADDIAVLYFEPNLINQNTKIKRIRITKDGDFLDKWPAGFFNDRETLLFDNYE